MSKPVSYIELHTSDPAKAKSLGGSILKGRTEVPGEGFFAVIADPTGGTIALWEALRKQ